MSSYAGTPTLSKEKKAKKSKLLAMQKMKRAREAQEARTREEEERSRREAEAITAHIEDLSLEDTIPPELAGPSKLDLRAGDPFFGPCPDPSIPTPPHSSYESIISSLSLPSSVQPLSEPPATGDLTFRVSTPPPPLPFRTVRSELICQVHLDVLGGGSFADTNVNLYSRRGRTGSAFAPRALALNRRILEAASPEFQRCEFELTMRLVLHVLMAILTFVDVFAENVPVDADGYVDDSDLEDEVDDATDLPGTLTMTSLPDSFDYQEPQTPTEEDITTRLGDADLMTDDEDVSLSILHWMFQFIDWFCSGEPTTDIRHVYTREEVANATEQSR